MSDGSQNAPGDKKPKALETDYYSQAQIMKQKLDGVSSSMCLAKWLQVSMHLTNGLTQSCYHPPVHKMDLEELAKNPKALHNTEQKKRERQMMKAGERPKGCEYCWKIEDAPGEHMSDRHYRSGEPWAREAFDEVVSSPFDYDVNPRYVEVNFNQTCNLACAYCSPHISTTWEKEINQFGAYPTLVPHNDIEFLRKQGLMPITKKSENPYLKAFWEYWPELYQDLKVFRMTGGEPLLDPNTFKVLKYIQDKPKGDLELAITSNMCVPDELFNKFIDQMKDIVPNKKLGRFMLFPSVDTWGEQAAYIRHGMDWDIFWTNVNRYLDEVDDGLLTFIVTMNALSVPGLKRFMEGVLELQKRHNKFFHRVFLDVPYLRYPDWLSLQNLPTDYYPYIEETISFMKSVPENESSFVGFRDFWIAKMERVFSWMKQDVDPDELIKRKVNFYRFFTEYDYRKSTDFLKTFPEFESFWQECESLSLNYPEK